MGARNGCAARLRVWGIAAVSAVAAGACVFGGGDSPAADPLLTETTSPAAVSGQATASPTVAVGTPVPPTADISGARALYREGRFGEARDAFRRVAEVTRSADERTDALVGSATAAFELNDDVAALAALEMAVASAPGGSASGLRAAYLLTDHYDAADRYEDAVAVYTKWAPAAAASPIGPYFLNAGAIALGGVGRIVEADAVWEHVLNGASSSPALRTSVYRAQAGLARAQGDDVRLRQALTALVAATGEPGARIELSEVSGRLGDSVGMLGQLRAIVAQSPASVYAGIALERLQAGPYAVDAGQAGLVYYRHGSYARAAAVLREAVAEPGISAEQLAFRGFYLGATYEDSGEPQLAVRFYDLAAESGANSAYVHRARYWAARVTEGEGDAAEASRRYVSLVREGPPGEFSQEAAFRAGYVLFRTGDTRGAIATWDDVSGSTSARLEYWRGRALAASGAALEATQAYRRAVTLGRYDLHGLEAARELGEGISLDVRYQVRDLSRPIDWAVIETWLRSRIGGGPSARTATAACELASGGLRSAAEQEILSADAASDIWDSYVLMKEASQCGLTSVAAQLAVKLRVDAEVSSEEPPADLLRLSYPIDFAVTLDGEARKAGVDPLFLASLVRQESFWDPSAGSVAGALGLTQVIPQTGRAIADQLGVVDFEPQDLFKPSVSLEFGAYYLGGELRGYASPLLALAAYNAGPGPAARWSAAGSTRAADLVETIDYTETRNYVTYVYEAYAHYLLAWATPIGS